jgi:HK97 family phage major capsid protein
MATTTTSAAVLTPEQTLRVLVRPLEAKAKFLACGPTIYDTHGPIKLPKLGGPVTTIGTTAEGAQIPSRDATFGSVSLLPSTLDSFKVWTSLTNEVIRQSVISISTAVQQRLVTDVANEIDSAFFSGSGDGVDTIRGLFAYSGVQTVDLANTAITYDHLIDAEEKALTGDVDTTRLRWLFDVSTYIKLRKVKTATSGSNQYLLQPDVTRPGQYTIFGYPVTVTNKIPQIVGSPNKRRGALVDFSQIAVARDLAPTVTLHPDTEARNDQTGLRVVARYDAAPLNAAAVIVLNNILL